MLLIVAQGIGSTVNVSYSGTVKPGEGSSVSIPGFTKKGESYDDLSADDLTERSNDRRKTSYVCARGGDGSGRCSIGTRSSSRDHPTAEACSSSIYLSHLANVPTGATGNLAPSRTASSLTTHGSDGVRVL